MKKLWQTPELIVLARNTQEEAVLSTCKVALDTGPASANSECALAGVGCNVPCANTGTS